jgi:hypothetical protein
VPFGQVPQTGQADTLSLSFDFQTTILFGYEFPFQTLTNATLELWINPTPNPSAAYSFIWTTSDAGNQNRFNFYLTPTNQACQDYLGPLGGVFSGCSANGMVPFNQWSYIAYVKQGNVYSIWLNNSVTGNVTTLVSQITNSAPLPTSLMWTMNGRLYAEPDHCCQFTGLVDEVRLSDAALSPNDFLVAPELSVTINIKPPSQAPVAINLKSPTLPVAILSSPSFDATTQVNRATVNLSGAPVRSCAVQDVAMACLISSAK